MLIVEDTRNLKNQKKGNKKDQIKNRRKKVTKRIKRTKENLVKKENKFTSFINININYHIYQRLSQSDFNLYQNILRCFLSFTLYIVEW